jgi:hypothetical protein
MSKKRREFPMEVQSGSVIVKIYKVENKGATVSRSLTSRTANES